MNFDKKTKATQSITDYSDILGDDFEKKSVSSAKSKKTIQTQRETASHELSKRTALAAMFILLIIPAALIGMGSLMQTVKIKFNVFDTPIVLRLHYLASLLIIICTMIPFFMVFEKRKPQARELITIATLAAIAVAGRWAFFFWPQFKPVCAVVIISGVCFGAESGFLVGAVTGFVSNFLFGQGAHTPWQMFCFGIIGFIAGLLFKKGLLRKNKIVLAIFGGIAVFVIYGGIINIGTMLGSGISITGEAVLARYISAVPMDLIHAGSTVVFLLALSEPMIEKLDRIKIKYGLIEP